MRLTRSLGFMIWAGLSLVWVVATGVFVAVTWDGAMRDVHALYDKREQQCTARYSDPQAKERCLLIMDLERFQSRSIAMFNRALLAGGPPLAGLGLVIFLHRRANPARAGKRKPRND